MKKYFYTNGIDKIGPFSLEELKQQNLTRETKVWFYGLGNWKTISEIDELESITYSIPPKLKVIKQREIQKASDPQNANFEKTIRKKTSKNNRNLKRGLVITFISTIIFLVVYIYYMQHHDLHPK